MWKALSSKYRGRMQLGLASADNAELKASLNITGVFKRTLTGF